MTILYPASQTGQVKGIGSDLLISYKEKGLLKGNGDGTTYQAVPYVRRHRGLPLLPQGQLTGFAHR